MNPLEAQLDYPLGDTIPAPGTVQELAPGLCWIRMPLPFALDHINLWLLRDEQDGRSGWSVVDCGAGTDATRAAWEQVLAEGGPAIVSAGAANAPAIGLYEGLGFRLVDTVVVEGGLRIAQFGHPGLI